jgi:hypothetical protein
MLRLGNSGIAARPACAPSRLQLVLKYLGTDDTLLAVWSAATDKSRCLEKSL